MTDQKFYVVGGEYADTSFSVISPIRIGGRKKACVTGQPIYSGASEASCLSASNKPIMSSLVISLQPAAL